jgi:archaellum component FlaC
MGKKRFRINPRLFKKIKMTNYEQITQLTEVILNLEKDITSLTETVSKDDLPNLEQYYQYLESTLQELKNQKEKLISEL